LGNDEDRLLYQKWMHTDDKKKTVEIFLNENQLNVNDFVRFECGEEI
jgi:translation elongation factor EF-Ts